jgi:undecaprenyl-diphosphatase
MTRLNPQLCIGLLVATFSLLALGVYLDSQPYFTWDLRATRLFQEGTWSGLPALMRGASLAGDNVFLSALLVLVASLVLLRACGRLEAAVLLLAVAMGQVIKIAVKDIVGRPRPDPGLVKVLIEAKEIHSFPSGHTVHYVVFFGFLWFLAFRLLEPRRWRWPIMALLGGLLLLIGPARVYLGAHWTSDVLGGYLLGTALLLVNIRLYHRWSRPRSTEAALKRHQGLATDPVGHAGLS